MRLIYLMMLGCLTAIGQVHTSVSAAEAQRHETAGMELFAQAHFDEAIREFETAVSLRPDSPRALYYLVRSYRLTRKTAEAAEKAKLLLSHDSAYSHELMGEAYDAQFQDELAHAEFEKAVALDPALPEAHFALGVLSWRHRDYEGAIGYFREEMEVSPRFARPLYYEADIALRQNRTTEAIELLQRSLSLAPAQYDALCALGNAYESVGRTVAALDVFKTAEDLKPNDSFAHYRRSRLLRRLGRTGEAEAEERLTRGTMESSRYPEVVLTHERKPD